MESCILYQSPDKGVTLIDIPRSLEQAQTLPGFAAPRRIVSSRPLESPWQNPGRKKDQKPQTSVPQSAAVAELMTLETVRSGMKQIRQAYTGPWCLTRVYATQSETETDASGNSSKRKAPATTGESGQDKSDSFPYIPAESQYLLGSIEDLRARFVTTAPKFDAIVLDPPWPSRSVKRRRDSYHTTYNIGEVQSLLSLIPIAGHLKSDGLVAVWVTNKTSIVDLLTSPGGIFDRWNVELIGEWIWLKVTSKGEPIVDVESSWRKPWERLLIARVKGSTGSLDVNRRLIVGVPDLHSRKPNLRILFGDIFPKGCLGLEVFARNLTAGWWAWGDEATMFQERYHWVDDGATNQKTENAS